jgi:hypothetical protein
VGHLITRKESPTQRSIHAECLGAAIFMLVAKATYDPTGIDRVVFFFSINISPSTNGVWRPWSKKFE